MTLNRLHKLLGELIAQGHGRRDVYVDKSSFRDNRENDGVCIMPVSEIDIQTYEVADDDGGWAFDSRGRVKERTSLVIYGGCRERPAPETSAAADECPAHMSGCHVRDGSGICPNCKRPVDDPK